MFSPSAHTHTYTHTHLDSPRSWNRRPSVGCDENELETHAPWSPPPWPLPPSPIRGSRRKQGLCSYVRVRECESPSHYIYYVPPTYTSSLDDVPTNLSGPVHTVGGDDRRNIDVVELIIGIYRPLRLNLDRRPHFTTALQSTTSEGHPTTRAQRPSRLSRRLRKKKRW